MKILKQEKLPKSQIKLTIEVSKDELSKYIDKTYDKLKGEVKIAGFRPGKAPRFMVEKEVGSEKFQKEALEIALPETYYGAIKEAGLMPIGPPEVKLVKFIPTDTLVYETIISIVPEFDLGNYQKQISSFGKKSKEIKVEESQIDEVIKNLQKQRSKTKEVLREAKKGDKVEIDFEGSIDGQPISGASSKNHPLIIGDNVMIPGFEDNLLGMKKGEEKEFNISFPSNFNKKDLAGKKAHFKVKLNEVCEIELPKLDDDLVKKMGHKNIIELKADIKKSLAKEFEEKENLKFENELIEKLIKDISIEIPQSLIDEELKGMFLDFEQRLAQTGLTLDRYLEQIKKSKDEIKKEWQGEAEKRIKIALILDKMARQEKIEVSDKEVKEEIDKILKQTQDSRQKEVSKNLENEEQKKYIKNVLKNRKVMDYIKNLAQK